jgi:hypothetical protein
MKFPSLADDPTVWIHRRAPEMMKFLWLEFSLVWYITHKSELKIQMLSKHLNNALETITSSNDLFKSFKGMWTESKKGELTKDQLYGMIFSEIPNEEQQITDGQILMASYLCTSLPETFKQFITSLMNVILAEDKKENKENEATTQSKKRKSAIKSI